MTSNHNNNHFAINYIGKNYQLGASGPHNFDCWGLVVFINKKHFNINLPSISISQDNLLLIAKIFNSHPEKQNWKQIKTPKEGDCVLMRKARYSIHVGIWLDIDGGGVLHCIKGNGVVFQNINSLKLSCWQVEGYYRYVG